MSITEQIKNLQQVKATYRLMAAQQKNPAIQTEMEAELRGMEETIKFLQIIRGSAKAFLEIMQGE